MTTAWRIMLCYRDAAISRFLFSIGALMVHPSFQDLLLLSDIAVLTPNDLYSLMLKLKDAIIDWLTAVDEVMILQLALMYLHPAAVLYPDVGDLWKWGCQRPPATIFDSVDDYHCQNTECFNDLNFHQPLAMWSTDDAFVEVKCSEKPDCLTVQRSLSSVALIVVSGCNLLKTKADEMDNGWDVFVCVCFKLRHGGDMFLGTWQARVKHFVLMDHENLPLESLDKATKLFCMATAAELVDYADSGRVWACSRCHEYEDMKATRAEIIAHLNMQ
ncbi:hypothetical protein PM082_004479 [Marasmius tenuissimus]|nr:hypothetical protein PM082_004479 [Marasmius tenuissimus]